MADCPEASRIPCFSPEDTETTVTVVMIARSADDHDGAIVVTLSNPVDAARDHAAMKDRIQGDDNPPTGCRDPQGRSWHTVRVCPEFLIGRDRCRRRKGERPPGIASDYATRPIRHRVPAGIRLFEVENERQFDRSGVPGVPLLRVSPCPYLRVHRNRHVVEV